jgi:hypothetical protein
MTNSNHAEQENEQLAFSEVERIVRERIASGKVSVAGFTEREREALIELTALYQHNQIAYRRRLKELKSVFDVATTAIDAEVKKRAEAAFSKDENDNLEAVDELIVIAKREAELWQDQTRRGFATFRRDGHLEHHKVEGRDFQDFLSEKYGEKHQWEWDGKLEPIYPSREALKEATYHIESAARIRGAEVEPRIKIKDWNNELWIDGGGRDWSGYRVSADGWKHAPQLLAQLIRGDGMKSLPAPPARDGNIAELRKFANVKGEDFALLCGDIAATLNPFGNYLTTFLCGPPGSGKTTVTRIIRGLSDPHKIATRRAACVRDLMHGAANTYVLALENVSEISAEMSDAICALNTKTGYAERKYYAQGIEVMWEAHCPVLINGIPYNLAERSDLADRAVTFVFDYLGDRVRSDDVFWREFDKASPRIFGAVLDGVVGALRVRQEFRGDIDEAAEKLLDGWRPRFVDAVVWAEAACRQMGFEPGEFVEAYKNNQLVALRYIGEHNPICVGIRKLIAAQGSWQGYPSELRAAIRPYTLGLAEALQNDVWVARKLPMVTPVLSKLYNISVTMNKRLAPDDNRNGIVIEKLGVGRGMYSEPLPAEPKATPVPFRRRL